MAGNAESVVVELQANLDAFNAAVKRGEIVFDESMVRIAKSATKAEKAISDNLGKVDKPFMNAATRTRQLGVQIGQLGSSLGSGISPMTALAQQASDFAYVLGGTEGAAGRVATFFSGPWGAALLAAGLTIGVFASRMKGATDATADQVDKLRKHAEQTVVAEAANRIFGRTLEGVEDAMRHTRDALDKLNEADKTQAQLALQGAEANLIRTRSLRGETNELLANARAHLANQQAILTGVSSPAAREFAGQNISTASAEVERLQGQLNQIDGDITNQQRMVNELRARFAAERASANADPVQRIHTQYDALVKAAATRATAEGLVGTALDREVAKRTLILRLQEQAAVKAAQEANRTSHQLGTTQTAQFILPVEGRITSGFGPRVAPTRGASSFHPAIDIAAPIGTPVHAAAGGVVVTTGRMGGLGNVVIVDHGGGTISEYGHLSAILARTGQRVGQGDVIGQVGSTGISTGPHVDFRVRVGGRYVDPRTAGGHFPVDELAAGTKANQLQQQAEREAQQAAARETAYQNELEALEGKLLQQQRNKLLSTDEQLALSEREVIHDRDAANSSYEGAVKSGRINQAQADILTAKNNELATARTQRLYAEEGLRRAAVVAALDEQTRQANIAQLQDEVQTAKTGAQRRDAMLRLLDAETELTRIKLQQQVDATASGTLEHELAVLKLQQLNDERARRAGAIARDPSAMTPGQGYVAQITRTAAQLNEDFDKVAVGGLQKLNDELASAIMGTETLGQAFHNVAGQIVSELVRIAIQQAIIKPLANLLFPQGSGGSGSGVGGVLGFLFNAASLFKGGGGGAVPGFNIGGGTANYFGANPIGGRASGGAVAAGMPYWVGEHGPEPFIPSQAGNIIPNSQLMRGGMSGHAVVEVHVIPNDERFNAYVGRITEPSIARASVAAARGGSMLARQSLIHAQIHQLG